MKLLFSFNAVLAVLAVAPIAQADIDTSPYLFTDQAAVSTGHFEWDELSDDGPPSPGIFDASPDVANTGGAATLDASDFALQPMDGPPLPLVTATQNIYSGGTLVDYDIDLTGLSTTDANTTVVLQLGVLGDLTPGSFLLDGAAPTEFVDRGVAENVAHDTDGANAEFNTHYYWAEWQVAAAATYEIEFTHLGTHTSLTQARVEYFNSPAVVNAAAPGAVPEPSTMALFGLAACGGLVVRLRRQFDEEAVLS